MKNLNEMTVKELKELAKNMKISNWWNLKKDALIAGIEEKQAAEIEEVEPEVEEQPANTLVETPAPEKPVAILVDEEKPQPKRGALLEYDGKAQNICAWGKELGISPNTLYGRIYKMGWSVEKAFTTPARKK